MVKFIIFEPSKEHQKRLMRSVRSHMGVMGARKLAFECLEPGDVFSQPMPEAARHFGKLQKEISIVAVSDSEEYGLEGYSFAEYYLLRPFSVEELGGALRKCVKLRMG